LKNVKADFFQILITVKITMALIASYTKTKMAKKL